MRCSAATVSTGPTSFRTSLRIGDSGDVAFERGEGRALISNQTRQKVLHAEEVQRRETTGIRAQEGNGHSSPREETAQRRNDFALGGNDLLQLRQGRAALGVSPGERLANIGQQRAALAADDLLQHVAGRGVDHRAPSLSWVTGPRETAPGGLARKRFTA